MQGEPNQTRWRGVQPVSGIRGIWPARNSLRINKTGTAVAVQSTVIYTVPANKILFISSLFMSVLNSPEQIVEFHAWVEDVDHGERIRLISTYLKDLSTDTSSMAYLPALEAEADWHVHFSCDKANAFGRLIFSGWLEDA